MKKLYNENAADSLAGSLSETFSQMVPTRKNWKLSALYE